MVSKSSIDASIVKKTIASDAEKDRYQQIGEPTPVMSEGSDYESKTDSKRPKSTVMLDYQGKD